MQPTVAGQLVCRSGGGESDRDSSFDVTPAVDHSRQDGKLDGPASFVDVVDHGNGARAHDQWLDRTSGAENDRSCGPIGHALALRDDQHASVRPQATAQPCDVRGPGEELVGVFAALNLDDDAEHRTRAVSKRDDEVSA